MVKTRTVNDKKWTYCDCEGFWWNEDMTACVSRTERNQNVWTLWDGKDYNNRQEYPTMKKAME